MIKSGEMRSSEELRQRPVVGGPRDGGESGR